MTAGPHDIDPARFLQDQLDQASPNLMRDMLSTFINALLSAQADSVCGAEYGTRDPDRVNSRNGYRHRELDTESWTPGSAPWMSRSRNCARAACSPGGCWSDTAAPSRPLAGPDNRGRDLLPARGQHPPDGQTRPNPRDHRPVQVTSQRDGPGPRRAGRGVPHPPVGRRPLHLRGRRRAHDESAREQTRGQDRGHDRDRCQRRRVPRNPRNPWRSYELDRVRPRMAQLPPGPGRPRLDQRRDRSGSSPPTRTPASSKRSVPPCPARPGNDAAPTTPRT